MKTWKIIQIYHVQADSKKEALSVFHNGDSEKFFDSEFAVEPKPSGFWAILRDQVLG